MPDVNEAAARAGSDLAGVLHAAVETISARQQITFTRYVRRVLPLDGFVYWVKAAIVEDDGQSVAPFTRTVTGSLHRQACVEQTETVSQTVNTLIFTPLEAIDDFTAPGSDALWTGEYDGVRFAFSRMDSQYTRSGIFHYMGRAILPAMLPQLIDDPAQLDEDRVICNSLPVWLSMDTIAPVWPAFLVPRDITPPWIAVDIRETRPLSAAPAIVPDAEVASAAYRSHFCSDRVRVTLYGFSNDQALAFVDGVVERACLTEEYGISNIPVVHEEKLNQPEIDALARRKYVDFEINYHQCITRALSRQRIRQALLPDENLHIPGK